MSTTNANPIYRVVLGMDDTYICPDHSTDPNPLRFGASPRFYPLDVVMALLRLKSPPSPLTNMDRNGPQLRASSPRGVADVWRDSRGDTNAPAR
jgi:hypothetical protein